MATRQETVDYILDQFMGVDAVSARRMFGEYALYCEGRVVGLICDDILYIKNTDEGKKCAGSHFREGYAYTGAKLSMRINEELIEDREWLSELVRITALHVSLPKKKKK